MHIGHTSGRGEFGSLHSYGSKDASQGIKRETVGVYADANPTVWHSAEAQAGRVPWLVSVTNLDVFGEKSLKEEKALPVCL